MTVPNDFKAKTTWIIYRLRCTTSGKSYIGQTSRPLHIRWAAHMYAARNPKRHQSAIHMAIKFHGPDTFEKTILEAHDSQSLANTRERELIDDHCSQAPHGYNINTGGNREPHTDFVKAKMRQNHISRSPEGAAWRRRISEGHGRKLTDEQVAWVLATYRPKVRGYNQYDLAEQLGVSQSVIGEILHKAGVYANRSKRRCGASSRPNIA